MVTRTAYDYSIDCLICLFRTKGNNVNKNLAIERWYNSCLSEKDETMCILLQNQLMELNKFECISDYTGNE